MRRLRVFRPQTPVMEALGGVYSLSGQSANLTKARALSMQVLTGVFQASGQNATLRKSKYTLTATSGSYLRTGYDANWIYTPTVPVGPQYALVFPSNGGAPVGEKVAFRFTGSNLPNITPITIIWRIYPVQQTGYWTTFFHTPDETIFVPGDDYFGCHPYPEGGSLHKWEISAGGGDERNDLNGHDTTVIMDQWYTQASVNSQISGPSTQTDFYWNLGVDATHLIRRSTQPGTVLTNGPSPHLIWGDNTWADERLSGRLRGVQIYAGALSVAQIQARMNLTSDALVVAMNPGNLWYCNLNPTPDDITDKSGQGHHPTWYDTANKATLWTDAPSGSLSTSFTLRTTAATNTYPFSLGMGFKQGDVYDGQIATNLTNYQVKVKRTWSDGSVKHAIISGRASLTQNVTRTVTMSAATSQTGTALTEFSIRSAAPTATVQCGSFGTVSLATLVQSPAFRTWISGHEMVECHYRADVGGSTLLSVWFHVRLYAGTPQRLWIRAICENGYLDTGGSPNALAANADRTYTATVNIGGSNVYTQANLAHYKNTRWSVEGWIGGNPAVTTLHDTEYLTDTKLVPYYGWRNPTTLGLDNWNNDGPWVPFTANYTPMSQCDTAGSMGGTGYGPFIGLLPLWNALYATSGDARALKWTLNNSSALNSRPIVWRSRVTECVPKPSSYQTWNYEASSGGGGADTLTPPSGLGWDQPHHPCEGYLAYLLTGDYWHYETLAMGAALNYLIEASNQGNGINRHMDHTQARGVGWMIRTVGAYAAIAPTGDAVAADYRDWLNTGGFGYWITHIPPGGNGLGVMAIFGNDQGTRLRTSPWQNDFWVASNGFVWDMEPGFSNTSNHQALRDYMYKFPIGRAGGSGATEYSYTNATYYGDQVSSPPNGFCIGPGTFDGSTRYYYDEFYTSWGDVWTASWNGLSKSLGALQGSGGGSPNIPRGYWGNYIPALAYAVDHGATGAQAGWNRLIGASNWSTLANSGFDDTPLWGVTPRFVAPYTLPSTVNTSTLIGSNSAVSVKPSSHSDSQLLESLFAAYSGPTFVPTYSAAGAAVYAVTGGHANIAMHGTVVFDFTTGTWSYFAPGNGIVESPNPHAVSDLNGLTHAELTAATSGEFPANPHPAASRAFLNEGSKGSVVYIGRWSVDTGGSDSTNSIHKMSLADRQWHRAGNNTLAYGGINSSYAYDPTTNRYYAIKNEMHTITTLSYWDPVTQTTGTVGSFTPVGLGADSWRRAFIDDSLRVLFYHHGPKMFGMNLNNINAGWVDITHSGCPSSGNAWVYCSGAWWLKESNNGNSLVKYLPGANPLGGTGAFSSVTIGGSGLPSFFGTEALHYSHLMAVPGLGSGFMAWISNGNTTNTVAIIKV